MNVYQVAGQGSLNSSGSYTYDLANNLQGGAGGWTYNTDNQLTSAPPLGGLAGATGLAYDAAGNLIAANGMTLSYDARGYLSSVSGTPWGTLTFTTDAFGRRTSKSVNGQTTYFLYNGDALIAEVDAGGNVQKSYTWGALGLVSDRVNGPSRFYLYDRSGGTRAQLDASGNLLSRGAYTAWGSPYGSSPNTPLAWNGRWGVYQDAETGLVLMGARYYAPTLGRFISRDSASFLGGINLYGYCGGDPLNYTDPDGAAAHLVLVALGGGMVGGLIEGGYDLLNGRSPWRGFGRGFVKGAVGSAVFVTTLGVAPAVGITSCLVRTAVASASCGVAVDAVGQGIEIASGERTRCN